MTLLKDDGSISTKEQQINIITWPTERLSTGLGISFKDGFYFGIGFGVAITIALPIILFFASLFVIIILAIFGGLGNLWL